MWQSEAHFVSLDDFLFIKAGSKQTALVASPIFLLGSGHIHCFLAIKSVYLKLTLQKVVHERLEENSPYQLYLLLLCPRLSSTKTKYGKLG